GKTLALALGDNRQEELLNATVKLAAEAVRNNRELIRERVKQETPWWVPPVVDDKIYQKIIVAVERLLQDMVMDPAHPLRTAFDDAIRDFIERLQHSPEVIARAEALKEEWLMGAQTDELARKLWEGIRQAVSKHATGTDGGTGPLPVQRRIHQSNHGTSIDGELLDVGPPARLPACPPFRPGSLQPAGEPRRCRQVIPDAVPHEDVALRPEHLIAIAIPSRGEGHRF